MCQSRTLEEKNLFSKNDRNAKNESISTVCHIRSKLLSQKICCDCITDKPPAVKRMIPTTVYTCTFCRLVAVRRLFVHCLVVPKLLFITLLYHCLWPHSFRTRYCHVVYRLVVSPGRKRSRIFPGRGGTWTNLCWVCAASLSEPLPHYSHILWPIIDPILVTFG